MFIFLSVCAVCHSLQFCGCLLPPPLAPLQKFTNNLWGGVVVNYAKSSSTKCSTKSESPGIVGECTRVHSQVFCSTR